MMVRVEAAPARASARPYQSQCPIVALSAVRCDRGERSFIVPTEVLAPHSPIHARMAVRGANLYLEDGNEMENRLLHNVAICPHARLGPMRGCTVPGTDNSEADTSLNQAGLWALPFHNHIVGNRFANSFNGLFVQSAFSGGDGRGAVEGKLCTEAQPAGRIQGNTCHGHDRFGTYVLGPNFPRPLDASVATDGKVVNRSSCAAFSSAGIDRGVSIVLADNVDYQVVFVGQCERATTVLPPLPAPPPHARFASLCQASTIPGAVYRCARGSVGSLVLAEFIAE